MQYRRVADEAELLDALKEPGAAILSGGTDLLVKIRGGLVRPKVLVDIGRLPSLRGIRSSETEIAIGSATPESEILSDPSIRETLPLLTAALASLGSVQIRNRGTLGGNLVNASPAADSAVPLLLYDAEIDLISLAGERVVPVETFFAGPGKTVLRPGEFVRTVRIPVPMPVFRPFYHKVGKRQALTIAIASLGALIRVDGSHIVEARLAAGSVAPTPLRLRTVEKRLRDVEISDNAIADARRFAAEAVSPIDDVRATAAYRRDVVGALVQRAVQTAFDHAD